MFQPARTESPKIVEALLSREHTPGKPIVVEASWTVIAYLVATVTLTESTRLLYREKGPYGGNLKWNFRELIGMMNFEWSGENHPKDRVTTILRACHRNRLSEQVFGEKRLDAGSAYWLVEKLRSNPTPALQDLHHVIRERMRENPPELTFATGSDLRRSKELVEQCLLLPYDERRTLVEAEKSGNDGGCSEEVVKLLQFVHQLKKGTRVELMDRLW